MELIKTPIFHIFFGIVSALEGDAILLLLLLLLLLIIIIKTRDFNDIYIMKTFCSDMTNDLSQSFIH